MCIYIHSNCTYIFILLLVRLVIVNVLFFSLCLSWHNQCHLLFLPFFQITTKTATNFTNGSLIIYIMLLLLFTRYVYSMWYLVEFRYSAALTTTVNAPFSRPPKILPSPTMGCHTFLRTGYLPAFPFVYPQFLHFIISQCGSITNTLGRGLPLLSNTVSASLQLLDQSRLLSVRYSAVCDA